MAQPDSSTPALVEVAAAASSKPKRVRTGCLTCRERHLKCDETFPGDCLNCRKSSRVCKRGLKLNFIDTQCKQPPVVPDAEEWRFGFMDESRDIASEYMGGLEQYSSKDPNVQSHSQLPYQSDIPRNNTQNHDSNSNHAIYGYTEQPALIAPILQHQQLASKDVAGSSGQQGNMPSHNMFDHQAQIKHESAKELSTLNSSYSFSEMPAQRSPYQPSQQVGLPEQPAEPKEILDTREETLYMQVFVEEVGAWMDSMDPQKHFSRLLPFHALGQPMLLNAFLACGARHLTLVNPATYKEASSLAYYDKASSLLLRALQNSERDSVICATTAVILNVYEIMTEKVLPRMNHIAGARALIKECGWNARSTGIGAACFWLNVGMELLSNLGFNWQSSWHPDTWGLNLDFSRETEMGREEFWTHRIVYVAAKIGDFRATIPKKQMASPAEEHEKIIRRAEEWHALRALAYSWNESIPRTMQPMAYLNPYRNSSGSAFPEVWLIKRSTIVARLFYHTALLLLHQVHPQRSPATDKEMHNNELYHAHQVCGITAHVKDRGVASVALRSLAIAGEVLTVRREQEEVLEIFKRIHNDTGWRIGFIPNVLREKWGWNSADSSPSAAAANANFNANLVQGISSTRPAQMDKYAPQNQPQGGMNDRYGLRHFDKYAAEMERQNQETTFRRHSQALSASSPMSATGSTHHQSSQQQQQTPPAAARKAMPQGIVNPMFATADFGMAKHPYQEYYVAPSRPMGLWDAQGPGLELGMYPPYSGHSQGQEPGQGSHGIHGSMEQGYGLN